MYVNPKQWASKEPNNIVMYALKIIDMLIDVVGPQGTILMATDSISNGWEFYMRKDVFDPQNDPSIRGVISEVFRRRKDVVRSEHPINNLTGWGQRAHALLDNHINSAPYTMDKNSPWYKLVETGGKVVLLGKGFEGNSLLHLTEYIYPEEFPRVVFLKKPVPIRAKGPTGEINTIETVLYTQAWKKGQGTHFCDYLNRKYHIYQAKKFDDYCNITVYNAKDQFEATTKEMKEDVTWYDPQFWPKEPV
jgi:aminoglycoside N3'-acetyltransferase